MLIPIIITTAVLLSIVIVALAGIMHGRLRAHRQLQHAHEAALAEIAALKLKDHAKDELLTTVSHDLKSPLTSLQMAVHLLLDDGSEKFSAQQLELLGAAREDADRIQKMIADILDKGRANLRESSPPSAASHP